MSRDWQCLYSTPVDSSERLQSLPQHPDSSRLNHVFTYVAQEVAEQLQQSHHSPVNRDSNLDETIAKRCYDSEAKPCLPFGNDFVERASAQIAIRVVEPEYRQITTIKPLSAQELKVLQLIVDGYKNATIAGKLYITENTVKVHVRNILKKLCVSGRTQAAIRALRSGLVH